MLQNCVSTLLIDDPGQHVWTGQDTHIIAYPIARGKPLDLVMMVPDDMKSPVGRYNEPGDVNEMRHVFKGYHDTIRVVLDTVDNCAKWVIAELPPLPTWSSQNKRVVLVGDACHAMTAHAASGAMASLEDAEVLGLCLATCKTVEDLPDAREDYFRLRKTRCERIEGRSRENAMTFSAARWS